VFVTVVTSGQVIADLEQSNSSSTLDQLLGRLHRDRDELIAVVVLASPVDEVILRVADIDGLVVRICR